MKICRKLSFNYHQILSNTHLISYTVHSYKDYKELGKHSTRKWDKHSTGETKISYTKLESLGSITTDSGMNNSTQVT